MKTDDGMKGIAHALEEILIEMHGQRMGFGLVVFSFGNKERVADYITNGKRENMVNAFREVADMLEQDKIIPPTIGEA